MKFLTSLICTSILASWHSSTYAQADPSRDPQQLPAIIVHASADASSQGLSPVFAGEQVARGARTGILGTHDYLSTPFNVMSYTNELIQDRQARSVGDVLQNDPGVRVARGFGNFQESYFIRGFILNSDDVAYNGLYSLLPRQYIATELFERVEILRGASAFLNGANPGGGGIGGAVNLLPKRATNDPLTRFSVSAGSGGQNNMAADVSRRFGPDKSSGIRVNAARRNGGMAIDDEKARLDVAAVGLDWHNRDVRMSADLGHQDNRLQRTRPNMSLGSSIASVPSAPDPGSNYAQPWSYSNERDLFGTLRSEFDLSDDMTAWIAYGMRRSKEANSLANLDLVAVSGAATTSRFDNTRKDQVDTGEIGLRGKLRTGPVKQEWVAAYSVFRQDKRTAYMWDYFNTLQTNLYAPTFYSQPAFSATSFKGNTLASPARTGLTRLSSLALGDTLSMLDDSLLFTAGLRHQKFDNADFAYDTGAQTAYERTHTSPMASILYKLDKQLSIYGNYVEGLTQGATAPVFGATLPLNAGQSLDPYVSKQREIGIKYEGSRFGGGLALFSTTKPRSLINAENIFTSEGEDRHRGVEVNVYGEIKRGLKLLGGATWLDTKQIHTGNTATDGKRVIGVPRTQANLSVEAEVPGLEGLAVDARAIYTGPNYADSANTLKVSGWSRLDVGARWFFNLKGQLATLRLRVNNVTNRRYWGSVGGYPDNGYLVVGSPRSVMLSGSIDF